MGKVLKLILTLGIILIIAGIGLYLYNQDNNDDLTNTFYMMELTVGENKVTIEPRKQLAKINDKEINLSKKEVVKFADYYLDYFQEIRDIKAKEDIKYLWTIKYQDNNLNNYYLGKDEYPDNWDSFLKTIDKLLGGKYFTKKQEIKEEADFSIKATDNINFNDSCNAYDCTYSVKTNEENLELEYIKPTTETGKQELLLNDKRLILDDFEKGGPVRLKVFNDIIVIMYQYGETKENRTLKFYNFSGKEVFTLDIIDQQYMGMYLYEDDFEIKDNYILINATRELEGNKLRINDNTTISYCNDEEKQEYDIDDSSIIRATYKINYIDNSFDLPIINNSTTLLSSGLLNNCQ